MASPLYLDAHILKKLQKLESWRTASAIAFDWLVIAVCIYICEYSGSWLVYAVGLVIIAGRMHALASLIHEFAHFRFVANKKVNDRVGDLVTAWPLLVTVASYRQNHLQHHQNTNTLKDPDFVVKYGQERFTFPQQIIDVSRHLATYVIGVNSVKDLRTGLDRLNKKISVTGFYVA